MDWDQRCIRFCAGLVAAAVALRLCAGGALIPLGQALTSPEAASFLLYLHTGRIVRAAPAEEWTSPQPPATEPESPLVFSPEDADAIGLDNGTSLRPDVGALLAEPLELELRGDGPRVLILHSHTTESFTGGDYAETSPYRTLDPAHNMLALGAEVAAILEEAGIGVIHDTAFHDYPSYNGSYTHAAQSTRAILEEYPSIQLILDLHRDAAETETGQMATACDLGGKRAAQLMFVLGTDERLKHPDWERNLSLALKLQTILETENPGICRDLNLTRNRYNQHLGDYALIVEIGAAGNTLDEARLAARELAEAIVRLADG
ncbi:MAG: stage II sporulation protein P [Oscillospiraceae bacterium]|nr:stage II sporulation protein P [Oscillospiraceae bacterium]